MSLKLDLSNSAPALNFTADIQTGKITALVGLSGSGKTSVLRTIAGLLHLEHESIVFEGCIWSNSKSRQHLPTHLRPIGFVSQNYTLFPHLTVLENVATALMHLAKNERFTQALKYLELSHIKGFETRYPHELSGGQKQRVALARALARQPKLLLLDEPFSAVDRSSRKILYAALTRLCEVDGVTIVFVTHDIKEATTLASQLIIISDGQQLQAGEVAEVLKHPCSEEAELLLFD